MKLGELLPNMFRRILIYLIPCRLLTSHVLPTKRLLEPYPRLQELFVPLAQSIRRGDLRSFDLALQKGEDVFVKQRIYLTLERGRDIALRNLLRKVFLAGGFEETKNEGAVPVRRTRVTLAEFQAAISMGSGGDTVDPDEVECMLANMMYKVSHKCSLTFFKSPSTDAYHSCALMLEYRQRYGSRDFRLPRGSVFTLINGMNVQRPI